MHDCKYYNGFVLDLVKYPERETVDDGSPYVFVDGLIDMRIV